jgi:hypothetical protein
MNLVKSTPWRELKEIQAYRSLSSPRRHRHPFVSKAVQSISCYCFARSGHVQHGGRCIGVSAQSDGRRTLRKTDHAGLDAAALEPIRSAVRQGGVHVGKK